MLSSSLASVVSTPAVNSFAPAGSALNQNVHRSYANAEGCGQSSASALRTLTNARHSRKCTPNMSYVVDIPNAIVLQRSSNQSKVTQIVHTMSTKNPIEAYQNMFGTMQRNYNPPTVSTEAALTDEFGFDLMVDTIGGESGESGERGGSKSGGVESGESGGSGTGERLVAAVGMYTLQAIPTAYNPPTSKPTRPGNWATVLNDYLGPSLTARQQEQVFMQTSKFVVIYDGYPKSTIHLLLIPRPSFFNCLWPKDVERSDLNKVQMLHRAAKELKRHIETSFFQVNGTAVVPSGTLINVGYHEKPSLQRMHIHLISNNFESPNMKTAKHRNSFMTDFFVGLDTFEARVEERL